MISFFIVCAFAFGMFPESDITIVIIIIIINILTHADSHRNVDRSGAIDQSPGEVRVR